jgi:hypothetical protein
MLNELLIFFREEGIEFWSKDSNDRLVEVKIGDSNYLPLYFFLDHDDLSIGKYAKEQFENKTSGAYGNYWNSALVEGYKIERFNNRYLFRDFLFFSFKENVFKEIVRKYYDKQTLDGFLKCGKILLLFDSFLNEEIRSMVTKGFLEIIGISANRISNIEYWNVFSELQIEKGNLIKEEGYIEISEAFLDLFFNLISKSPPTLLNKKVLPGRGNDPLLDSVLEYIAEKAITRGSLLTMDEIKKELSKDGQIILGKLKDGFVEHKIRLSDISAFSLNFHSDAILSRLNNKSSLNYIQNEFDDFRNQNRNGKIKIFLNGKTINSPSFKDFFTSTYSNVVVQSENFEQDLILKAFLLNAENSRIDAESFFQNSSSQRNSVYIPPPPPPDPEKEILKRKEIQQTNTTQRVTDRKSIVPPPPPPPWGEKETKKRIVPQQTITPQRETIKKSFVPPPLPLDPIFKKDDLKKTIKPPPPPPPVIKKEELKKTFKPPPPPPPVIKKEDLKKTIKPTPPFVSKKKD